MNIFDVIILIILACSVYGGIKDGVVVQVCSIMGIVLGLYLAGEYCKDVTDLVGLKGEYASVWSYAIITIGSVILVSMAAHALRKVLHFAGLGIFDSILGVALSLCKYLLILSAVFSVFNTLNSSYHIFKANELAQSKLFYPILGLTKWITPAWDWAQQMQQEIGNQINI